MNSKILTQSAPEHVYAGRLLGEANFFKIHSVAIRDITKISAYKDALSFQKGALYESKEFTDAAIDTFQRFARREPSLGPIDEDVFSYETVSPHVAIETKDKVYTFSVPYSTKKVVTLAERLRALQQQNPNILFGSSLAYNLMLLLPKEYTEPIPGENSELRTYAFQNTDAKRAYRKMMRGKLLGLILALSFVPIMLLLGILDFVLNKPY